MIPEMLNGADLAFVGDAVLAVCNADDPWTQRLLKDAACQTLFYSVEHASDLKAEDVELAADHVAFTAVTAEERVRVHVGIPGGFMVYNTLDVLGAAVQLGVSLQQAAEILKTVPHVKGRVEVVPTPGKDYTVLIDYAHGGCAGLGRMPGGTILTDHLSGLPFPQHRDQKMADDQRQQESRCQRNTNGNIHVLPLFRRHCRSSVDLPQFGGTLIDSADALPQLPVHPDDAFRGR